MRSTPSEKVAEAGTVIYKETVHEAELKLVHIVIKRSWFPVELNSVKSGVAMKALIALQRNVRQLSPHNLEAAIKLH